MQKVSAAPSWNVLETPRFTVVSQLSEGATRGWAEEFDRFIESLQSVITVDDRMLPPLTVVIFAREKDFKPYLPVRPNGKKWEVAGFFSHRDTWGIIGMPNRWKEKATRETIFHEGVHWFLSVYGRPLPLCVNEGLAEVFSTFEVKDGRTHWGTPIDYHLLQLRVKRAEVRPLADLVLTSSGSTAFNDDERISLFYAQSWAFVHYLMFGVRGDSKGSLGEFLNAYSAGGTTEEAFTRAFQMSSAQLDTALRAYLGGGKYMIGGLPIGPQSKVTGTFINASPERVEMALARLALTSSHAELALKHARAAVELAPANPLCFDTLACVLLERNPEAADGIEAAQRAITLGSVDGASYLSVGLGTARLAAEKGGIGPEVARSVTNHLERAICLRPNLKAAYVQLTYCFAELEQMSEEDLKFLRQGLTYFPDEVFLHVGVAQVFRKSERKEHGLGRLDQVLAHSDKMDPPQAEYARNLRNHWLFEDAVEQVRQLADGGRNEDALAVLDSFLCGDRLPPGVKSVLAQNRDSLAALANWDRACKALQEGRSEDAQRLLEDIVANPRIPGGLRRDAEERLLHLKE